MENSEKDIVERLEAATTLLEKTLSWLEERQGVLSGEVEQDLSHGGTEAGERHELTEKAG